MQFSKGVSFLFIAMLCASSNISAQNPESDNEFVINGTMPGEERGVVMLNYFVGEEWIKDSTEIREGKFKFKGSIASPVRASLYLKQEKEQRLNFYLESSDIQIQLNTDSIELSHISGSLSNIDFDSVNMLLDPYYASLGALKTLSEYARENHLIEVKEYIEALYDQLPNSQRKIITAYALSHPDSYAITGRLFINFTNHQTDLPLLKRIYNNFSQKVKISDGGQSIAGLIKRMERVQIGNRAPDFSLPNEKGREVAFSSFKGKYILLDFWASWCVPCRAESPALVKAFQKYKDNNFTIVSVSLDTDKGKWLSAIEEDQLHWTHLSSLKGYQEKGVRQLYSVQGIPDNFLIGPNGKILARGLRGAELEEKLSEIL